MKMYALNIPVYDGGNPFEIGAWLALKENGQTPALVTGSGLGAINAALIAAGNFEKAKEFWLKGGFQALSALNREMIQRTNSLWVEKGFDYFREAFLKTLLSDEQELSSLRKLMQDSFPEEVLRNEKTCLGFATCDLQTLEPKAALIHDIPEGKLIDHLLISAALPTFHPTRKGDIQAYDIKFIREAPMFLIKRFGCEEMVGFSKPDTDSRRYLKKNHIVFKHLACSEIISAYDFNKAKDVIHCMKLGYLDGLHYTKRLVGRRYYFDLSGDDAFYKKVESFLGTPTEDSYLNIHLSSLMDIPSSFTKQDMVSEIRSRLRRTIYKDAPSVLLGLMEALGTVLKVNRIQHYTPDGFLKNIFDVLDEAIGSDLNIISEKDENYLIHHYDPKKDLKPLDQTDFLALYAGIVTPNVFLNPKISKRFADSVTPETTLAMVLLLYLHYILQVM